MILRYIINYAKKNISNLTSELTKRSGVAFRDFFVLLLVVQILVTHQSRIGHRQKREEAIEERMESELDRQKLDRLEAQRTLERDAADRKRQAQLIHDGGGVGARLHDRIAVLQCSYNIQQLTAAAAMRSQCGLLYAMLRRV